MSHSHLEHRFDVYRAVTESIVEAIEAGAGPFVMPWHGAGATQRTENAHTRMNYHGVNVLVLWARACLKRFGSGYWASYKQWQEAGAQVRRGEEGTVIVFFKRLDEPDDETDADETERPRGGLVARASRVFNADQVTGWQPPISRHEANPVEWLEAAETFVSATGARVTHGGVEAFYSPSDDAIRMPDRDHFTGTPTSTPTEAYYATLLHELVHWTGAAHRLDRGLVRRGPMEVAAEELVAEIGAAFLCADLQVANAPRPDHAAYVAHWLELLRNDKRAVFTAARLAGTAASYLHDLAAAP